MENLSLSLAEKITHNLRPNNESIYIKAKFSGINCIQLESGGELNSSDCSLFLIKYNKDHIQQIKVKYSKEYEVIGELCWHEPKSSPDDCFIKSPNMHITVILGESVFERLIEFVKNDQSPAFLSIAVADLEFGEKWNNIVNTSLPIKGIEIKWNNSQSKLYTIYGEWNWEIKLGLFSEQKQMVNKNNNIEVVDILKSIRKCFTYLFWLIFVLAILFFIKNK